MNDIINNCIEVFKRDDNFKYMLKNDLRTFIDKNYGMKLSKQTSKAELVEIANKKLDEESIFYFCELPRFGLIKIQVIELLGINDYTLNKMVSNGQISIHDSISIQAFYGKGKMNLYSIYDVIYAEVPEIRKVIIPEMSEKNLEDAVYLVNKSAKVSRDTKQKKLFK